MTQNVGQLRRLLPVLRTAFQAEQLKMAKIHRRIETVKKQLHDIDRPSVSNGDTLDLAIRVGADLRWRTWAEERKTLLNRELALIMREKEEARGRMATALSKLEAAKQLEKRKAAEARLNASRRASW